MIRPNVYTTRLQNIVLAGANGQLTFDINIPNQTAKILSIYYENYVHNNVSGQVYYFPNFPGQECYLMVNQLATLMTKLYENPSVPASMITNGTNFLITKPGQYFFDSFFIRNTIRFLYMHNNLDIINSFGYHASVVVELEIIENR